jgi:hypothetical protein
MWRISQISLQNPKEHPLAEIFHIKPHVVEDKRPESTNTSIVSRNKWQGVLLLSKRRPDMGWQVRAIFPKGSVTLQCNNPQDAGSHRLLRLKGCNAAADGDVNSPVVFDQWMERTRWNGTVHTQKGMITLRIPKPRTFAVFHWYNHPSHANHHYGLRKFDIECWNQTAGWLKVLTHDTPFAKSQFAKASAGWSEVNLEKECNSAHWRISQLNGGIESLQHQCSAHESCHAAAKVYVYEVKLVEARQKGHLPPCDGKLTSRYHMESECLPPAKDNKVQGWCLKHQHLKANGIEHQDTTPQSWQHDIAAVPNNLTASSDAMVPCGSALAAEVLPSFQEIQTSESNTAPTHLQLFTAAGKEVLAFRISSECRSPRTTWPKFLKHVCHNQPSAISPANIKHVQQGSTLRSATNEATYGNVMVWRYSHAISITWWWKPPYEHQSCFASGSKPQYSAQIPCGHGGIKMCDVKNADMPISNQ